jgi:uncharacterized protein YbaP (TraB family)
MRTKLLLKLFFAPALLHPGYTLSAPEGQAAPAKPSYSQAAPLPAIPPVSQNRPKKSAAASTRGLLWKIESPGVKPSYLFGTIHSDDARITQLPLEVKERFDRAASFTMELIANGAGIVDMAQAMFFNDGQTLEKVLGKDLYARTLQALVSRGLPTQGIEKQKPWVVMMSLSVPKPRSGLVLDMVLQLEATKQEKPAYGLETMQEQIELFNSMSMGDQVHLLAETVRTTAQMDAQLEELLQTYLKRDLAGLMAASDKYQPDNDPVYHSFMDRLLNKRNIKMLQRMLPRLKEGNAFIAVGALHLPGPEGLLSLLEKTGYRTTPVY